MHGGEEDTVCPGCQRPLKDVTAVRIMPCRHAMCLACMRADGVSSGDGGACPVCGDPVESHETWTVRPAQVESKFMLADDAMDYVYFPDADSDRREEPAAPLTLEDLRNACLPEPNMDWECPICMGPYDNAGRVPMAVDVCFGKNPDMNVDQDDDDELRGVTKGCGHTVCEPCSVHILAKRRKEKRCPTCRGWVKSFGPDLEKLMAIVSEDGGRYAFLVRRNNELNDSVDPLALKAAEIPGLKKQIADKDKATLDIMVKMETANKKLEETRAALTLAAEDCTAANLKLNALKKEVKKLTRLQVRLREQEKISRTLFEDVITSRIRHVASGAVPASQLGITTERDAILYPANPPVKYIISTKDGTRLEYVREQWGMHRQEEEQRCAVIERYMAEAREENNLPSADQFMTSYIQTGGERGLVLVKTGTWLHSYMTAHMMAESMFDDADGADMNTRYVIATSAMLAEAQKRRDDLDAAAMEKKQEELRQFIEQAMKIEEPQSQMLEELHNEAKECISCIRRVVVECCVKCKEPWCDDPTSFCRHECPTLGPDYNGVRAIFGDAVGETNVAPGSPQMWDETWYRKACEVRIRAMMNADGGHMEISRTHFHSGSPLGTIIRTAVVAMLRDEGAIPDDDRWYNSIDELQKAFQPGHDGVYRNIWRHLWYHLIWVARGMRIPLARRPLGHGEYPAEGFVPTEAGRRTVRVTMDELNEAMRTGQEAEDRIVRKFRGVIPPVDNYAPRVIGVSLGPHPVTGETQVLPGGTREDATRLRRPLGRALEPYAPSDHLEASFGDAESAPVRGPFGSALSSLRDQVQSVPAHNPSFAPSDGPGVHYAQFTRPPNRGPTMVRWGIANVRDDGSFIDHPREELEALTRQGVEAGFIPAPQAPQAPQAAQEPRRPAPFVFEPPPPDARADVDWPDIYHESSRRPEDYVPGTFGHGPQRRLEPEDFFDGQVPSPLLEVVPILAPIQVHGSRAFDRTAEERAHYVREAEAAEPTFVPPPRRGGGEARRQTEAVNRAREPEAFFDDDDPEPEVRLPARATMEEQLELAAMLGPRMWNA